jgi:hypothetical protein
MELARVIKLNFKVARATVDQRRADLLADLEDQIARDDKELREHLQMAYEEVDAEIRAINERLPNRLEELGLPRNATICFSLLFRGWPVSHAIDDDCARLRRLALARTAADAEKAKLALSAAEAKLLTITRLASDALTSDAARAFLAEVPEVGELMPVLDLTQLQLMEGTTEKRLPFNTDDESAS